MVLCAPPRRRGLSLTSQATLHATRLPIRRKGYARAGVLAGFRKAGKARENTVQDKAEYDANGVLGLPASESQSGE